MSKQHKIESVSNEDKIRWLYSCATEFARGPKAGWLRGLQQGWIAGREIVCLIPLLQLLSLSPSFVQPLLHCRGYKHFRFLMFPYLKHRCGIWICNQIYPTLYFLSDPLIQLFKFGCNLYTDWITGSTASTNIVFANVSIRICLTVNGGHFVPACQHWQELWQLSHYWELP